MDSIAAATTTTVAFSNGNIFSTFAMALISALSSTWVLMFIMATLKGLSSAAFIVLVVNPFVFMCIRKSFNLETPPKKGNTFGKLYRFDVQSGPWFYMNQFVAHKQEPYKSMSIWAYYQKKLRYETKREKLSFKKLDAIAQTSYRFIRPWVVIHEAICNLSWFLVLPCLVLISLFCVEWYHDSMIRQAEMHSYLACANRDYTWMQWRRYLGMDRGVDCAALKNPNWDESWFARTVHMCLYNSVVFLKWYVLNMLFTVPTLAILFSVNEHSWVVRGFNLIRDFVKTYDERYNISSSLVKWIIHAFMILANPKRQFLED